MREISVPPLVTVPPESNVTDLVLRQAAKASNPALFSRLDDAGQWQDVRATDFLADVSLLAKGLMASGVAAPATGSASCPAPGTNGHSSTSPSGSPAPCRCRSTRPAPPRRSRGTWAIPAPSPLFGESAHHEDIIRQAATSEGLTDLAARVADRGRRPRRGPRRRRGTSPTRDRGPAQPGDARRPRDHHLHLGHHGPAQGLRADARQLRRNCSTTRWPASLNKIVARARPGRCCSCRSRTSSRGSSRCSPSPPASSVAHTPDIKNLLPDLPSSSRPSSSPCRASSRRSTTRRAPRPRTDGKGKHLPTAPRTRRSTTAARSARPRAGLGPQDQAHALRQARLQQAARRHGRRGASTPSPAAAPLGDAARSLLPAASACTILEGYGLTETTAPATREPVGAVEDRHRRASRCPARRADRRRRRDPASTAARVPGYCNHEAAPRRRSTTAGSTPATSARSTRTAS